MSEQFRSMAAMDEDTILHQADESPMLTAFNMM